MGYQHCTDVGMTERGSPVQHIPLHAIFSREQPKDRFPWIAEHRERRTGFLSKGEAVFLAF
jgi:hypothetical protein